MPNKINSKSIHHEGASPARMSPYGKGMGRPIKTYSANRGSLISGKHSPAGLIIKEDIKIVFCKINLQNLA